MDYKNAYGWIIARSINRVHDKSIHEKHHIIPRSLNGNNKNANIASLTFKEHYIAHKLLYKIHIGTRSGYKMLYAIRLMSQIDRYTSGKQYCHIRCEYLTMMRNRKVTKKTKAKISKARKGIKRTFTKEWIDNIAKHNKSRSVKIPDHIADKIITMKKQGINHVDIHSAINKEHTISFSVITRFLKKRGLSKKYKEKSSVKICGSLHVDIIGENTKESSKCYILNNKYYIPRFNNGKYIELVSHHQKYFTKAEKEYYNHAISNNLYITQYDLLLVSS